MIDFSNDFLISNPQQIAECLLNFCCSRQEFTETYDYIIENYGIAPSYPFDPELGHDEYEQ